VSTKKKENESMKSSKKLPSSSKKRSYYSKNPSQNRVKYTQKDFESEQDDILKYIVYRKQKEPDWKINIIDLRIYFKNVYGRNKIYAAINEFIKFNLIKRKYTTIGNMKNGCNYFLMEDAESVQNNRENSVKKSTNSTRETNQLSVKKSTNSTREVQELSAREARISRPIPPRDLPGYISSSRAYAYFDSSSSLSFSSKKDLRIRTNFLEEGECKREAEPIDVHKNLVTQPSAINPSVFLLNFISRRRKELCLKESKNYYENWELECAEKLLDLCGPMEIKKITEWCLAHEFWKNRIYLPSHLLKSFETIKKQMAAPPKFVKSVHAKTSDSVTEKNKKLSNEIEKMFPEKVRKNEIVIGNSYIEFQYGPLCVSHIKHTDHGFHEQAINNLRKMDLPVGGICQRFCFV
jgi:hypothetical protein